MARHLLADGWRVRALTRDPSSPAAARLVSAGAEVVRADLDSPESLRSAFAGAHGVFSVQNPMIGGPEVRQGTAVGVHANPVAADPAATRAVLPSAQTVQEWLDRRTYS
ncbi:NmrA family NAD(P)-binding protein [Lentzea sp. NPDC004789]